MLFLTAEEVAQLARYTAEPYPVLIYTAAYCGLRAGELGALRVKHLDLLRRRIHVKESLAYVERKGFVFGPTKTHETQVVPIPPFLADMLAAYLKNRPHGPEDLVFTARDGSNLKHNESAAKRGFMNKETADSYRVAATRVLKIDEDWENTDLRTSTLTSTCAASRTWRRARSHRAASASMGSGSAGRGISTSTTWTTRPDSRRPSVAPAPVRRGPAMARALPPLALVPPPLEHRSSYPTSFRPIRRSTW